MIATVILVGLGVLGGAAWLILGPLSVLATGIREEIAGVSEAISKGDDVHARLLELEDQVDRLPSKWEDVQQKAQSFYQRARHHVRRTQDELEERGLESAELDNLDREMGVVRERNEPTGGDQGVLPLSGSVAPTPPPPWAVPSIEDIIASKWR